MQIILHVINSGSLLCWTATADQIWLIAFDISENLDQSNMRTGTNFSLKCTTVQSSWISNIYMFFLKEWKKACFSKLTWYMFMGRPLVSIPTAHRLSWDQLSSTTLGAEAIMKTPPTADLSGSRHERTPITAWVPETNRYTPFHRVRTTDLSCKTHIEQSTTVCDVQQKNVQKIRKKYWDWYFYAA